ncbi:hypothetical protein OG589_20230 [Sphaerisporangium sp. NBC_01403]|uniref:hypothetical protein n=1 Tax=Sphaerisporangium sp. NBC_01403 TaxID=2903599 RepID=UPI00324912B1
MSRPLLAPDFDQAPAFHATTFCDRPHDRLKTVAAEADAGYPTNESLFVDEEGIPHLNRVRRG